MDKIDYETYDTMEQENSDSPAKKESKAAETSSKSRAAVAVVVVVLMLLGLTNVVLSTYTLTNLHSSKDVKPEANLTEQGRDDTVNESERLWNTIYEVEEELTLTKSNLLTTLPTLPREWMVEFLFKPTNLDNPDWTSIFHMTIGGNYENLGDRNPAVFFHPSAGLMISYTLNDIKNQQIHFPAPTIDKWTKIRMFQKNENGNTKVKLFIDNKEMLSAVSSKPTSFENVKVYASDPWYPAQPGSIKNLSIKIKRHWNSIFKIEEPFTLTKNNLLTTLPTLPREWMVEFMFKPTNYDNPGWTSIFRMTIGGNHENLGDRNPAVFFHPNQDQGLVIVYSLNNDRDQQIHLPTPTIDKWTKIRMFQKIEDGNTKIKLFINDKEMLSALNYKPTSFENVKVYASDPWHSAQPGSIKDLSINFIEE